MKLPPLNLSTVSKRRSQQVAQEQKSLKKFIQTATSYGCTTQLQNTGSGKKSFRMSSDCRLVMKRISSPIEFQDQKKRAQVLKKYNQTTPFQVLPIVQEINDDGKYIVYSNHFPNGVTLDKIDPSTRTPEDRILLATALLHALQSLHTHHFFHGDIKPTNILVHLPDDSVRGGGGGGGDGGGDDGGGDVGHAEDRYQIQFIDLGTLGYSEDPNQPFQTTAFTPLPTTQGMQKKYQDYNFLITLRLTRRERQVLDNLSMKFILDTILRGVTPQSIPPLLTQFIQKSISQAQQLASSKGSSQSSGGYIMVQKQQPTRRGT
jgi:serine/threonine protein kinase